MHDERKDKRKNLLYYLQVTDADTGKGIGRAVDISRTGLKLCSHDPISKAVEFNFTIDLPKAWHHEEPLTFKAESKWTKRDINPELFVTGFEFKDMEEVGQYIVDRLLSSASFSDNNEDDRDDSNRVTSDEDGIQAISELLDKADKILSRDKTTKL
ncbi:MAG: PilZ domain-containing protein [candidate division Zixibacteria bacterium]|nr:PilZ domain-containing protein [candidate division Zixibacteria bacterium]